MSRPAEPIRPGPDGDRASPDGRPESPLLGADPRRNEDERLLTGTALFVDDVHLDGMLHVAFVRSDHAHGRLLEVDLAEARKHPGVVAAYTAEDLGDYWAPGPLLVSPPPIERLTFRSATQVPLAKGKVRHVGEAIAMIVAGSRYEAEDAAALVDVDVEPLPPVARTEDSLADGAARIHEQFDSNLAAHAVQSKGDYEAAAAGAALRLRRRIRLDRGASGPIENRGVVAKWDDRAGELTVWDTTQAPIPIRNGLASMLGLPETHVRVVAPFIGGGFGPKIMMFYPEEVLLPWAAMRLGRPVKWIEDRQESFFATTQERDQLHEAEIALDADGRILGVRDSFLCDTGAYNPYGLTIPINSQCTLLGQYRVPNYESEFRLVYTNRPIVTPVRGAGRQHGVFVMERLLDLAADELGLDPTEIRRRNLLAPDDFPHDHEILYQDFAPLVYDSGDYESALDRALETIGYEEFKASKQPAFRSAGRHVGIGVACYVEGTGIGPYEGAKVSVRKDGRISLVTGVGTQGQGHFTSFAQLVAGPLGLAAADVDVVTGDTSKFSWGTGTFASRGAVVAGNACHAAAVEVREKVLATAAEALEADAADIVLADGAAHVRGVPGRKVTLGELAERANPLRGAVKPGTEPGLEATAYFGPERGCTASGVHAVILEVDRETAMLEILRYVVVHDCGTVINPTIVDGQIHGGVAHGIGNSFYEQLVFDEGAQLLNASFMDYLLPTATDVPHIETEHLCTPSPLNPLGIKGVGEAGAIPVPAVFARAIEDALGGDAPEILEMPLSPNRLFELMRDGR
ncbi:MAG: molybdopterin cofactor-binding domain-containing protein [Gemmatimonadota bacterium]